MTAPYVAAEHDANVETTLSVLSILADIGDVAGEGNVLSAVLLWLGLHVRLALPPAADPDQLIAWLQRASPAVTNALLLAMDDAPRGGAIQ